ncbi:MAG TPA: flavin reductase family protein [Mycobacteriales bacterium]|nr:flavin reductase family protein [Mycobacteriales bacterium]
MPGESSPTPAHFRQVLSRLATGVTVVATAEPDGRRHGMTVNSLTSVSLDPLLVLFCCERDASLHDPVLRTGTWAVSLLSAEQEAVSRWFTNRERRDRDQFADLDVRAGDATGAPLLAGALGWLECRTWATYDGGDHTIVVGEVLDLAIGADDADPLVYFHSRYCTVDQRSGTPTSAASPATPSNNQAT